MKAKIISANAGTGKTYTMALEFIKSINNKVDFDKILVITFTKKATFEIKERVLKFIKQIAFKEEGYLELVNNLNVDVDYEHLKSVYEIMLKNSENIRISTMDSFINKIFKNVIAPYKNVYNYEILDTNTNEYLMDIILEIMKNEKYLNIFKNYYNIDTKTKKVEDYTKNIKDILEQKPFFSDLVDKDVKYDKNSKYDFDYVKNLLLDFQNKFSGKYYANVEKLFLSENEQELLSNTTGNVLESKIIKSNAPANDEFEANILPVLCSFYYEKNIVEYNNIYRKFAKICYEIDENKKFLSKSFTYNDITFFTKKYIYDKELNLINNNTATTNLLNMIGGSINTMMIDEFQDTSYIQFYLFLPIIKTCENLLVVGDEKQSIYGFRGGDKRLFTNLDTLLKNNIDNVEIDKSSLDTCYRSKGNIIEFVNETFKNLDDFEYENVKYVKNDGYVNIKRVSKHELEDMLCEDIINSGEYNNVAVLCRNNIDIETYSKNFEKNNIKYQSIATNSIDNLSSIDAIYHLVHYLYSGNIYKLLVFLRSDLIGFNLFKIREFLENDEFEDEVITNIKKLKNDISNFKKKYISYFGYGQNPSSEDILNINKFLDLVESKNSLKEFIDYYEENKNSINKENVSSDIGVKLLTIHKSKGLEFNTVYSFVKIKSNTYSNYTLVKEYDENFNILEALFIKKKKVIEKVKHGNYYLQLCNKTQLEDELNNLYVALTRAKSNMYVYVIDESLSIKEDKIYGSNKLNSSNEIIKENEYIFTNKDFYNNTQYMYDNVFNTSIENEMKRKLGLGVHYFFQYLISPRYEQYAYSMLLKKYGNLIGIKKVDKIKSECTKYAKENTNIFNDEDIVYTEYEIFDKDESRYVIDRMNIDEKNKKIYIYDYKTTKNPDGIEEYKMQIENYKNIIQEQYKDYKIYTQLLAIDIKI